MIAAHTPQQQQQQQRQQSPAAPTNHKVAAVVGPSVPQQLPNGQVAPARPPPGAPAHSAAHSAALPNSSAPGPAIGNAPHVPTAATPPAAPPPGGPPRPGYATPISRPGSNLNLAQLQQQQQQQPQPQQQMGGVQAQQQQQWSGLQGHSPAPPLQTYQQQYAQAQQQLAQQSLAAASPKLMQQQQQQQQQLDPGMQQQQQQQQQRAAPPPTAFGQHAHPQPTYLQHHQQPQQYPGGLLMPRPLHGIDATKVLQPLPTTHGMQNGILGGSGKGPGFYAGHQHPAAARHSHTPLGEGSFSLFSNSIYPHSNGGHGGGSVTGGAGRCPADVWVVAIVSNLVVLSLLLASPASHTLHGAPAPSNHKQLRRGVAFVGTLLQSCLLAKAAAIAVGAPAEVWPSRFEQGATADVAGRPNAGLAYLFTSVAVAIITSSLTTWLTKGLIAAREEQYLESAPAATQILDPTLQPLLESGSTSAKAGSAEDGEEAAVGGKKGKKQQIKQATIASLVRLSYPDLPLTTAAFLAGAVAALASASVPYFIGQVIDFASIDPDRHMFNLNVKRLLMVSVVEGVVTGVRGGLFTIVMNKLNVRIRTLLFKTLLAFEIGFFDTTKTGQITSRLSADTSTVSDQISLNLNVILRSLTSAVLVLVFMVAAQWRLTIITFILIPINLLIAKVFGKYYRVLSKKVQAELAEANSIAEEVLSSMTTVKAHAAEVQVKRVFRLGTPGLCSDGEGLVASRRGGTSWRGECVRVR
ncbi:MAG: hypothetical protein WDW38_006918 [Sanguina aurantia]